MPRVLRLGMKKLTLVREGSKERRDNSLVKASKVNLNVEASMNMNLDARLQMTASRDTCCASKLLRNVKQLHERVKVAKQEQVYAGFPDEDIVGVTREVFGVPELEKTLVGFSA